MVLTILSGIFLGWSLGANDAANVFGPQTHSGIIRYNAAIILTSIFIILGALTEGEKCFGQIAGVTEAGSLVEVFIAVLSAAVIMHIMSFMKIPASSSQFRVLSRPEKYTLLPFLRNWQQISANFLALHPLIEWDSLSIT